MKVPEPWTNIEISQTEKSYKINVWGRTYTFEDSLFPTSILSQGEELLSAPVELKMDFGRGETSPYGCMYYVEHADEEKVLLSTAALCGNLIINVNTTLEYDGFIQFTMRMTPTGSHGAIRDYQDDLGPCQETIVRSARLVIPMKQPASTLMHFWPCSDNSVCPADYVSSGKFQEVDLGFKSSIWLGNEKYGLNFCMETDEQIQLKDPSKCVQTRRKGDTNELSIWLFDKAPRQWAGRVESWADPQEPISYEWMLQATPVKRITRETVEDLRIYRPDFINDDPKEVAKYGVRWVYFHENWSMIQNYWIPANRELIAKRIREYHELGIKVMVYFGYEYSSAMRDFEKHKDHYLNKGVKGNFTGGWTRGGFTKGGIYQKAFIVCYQGGYAKEMVDACLRIMDDMGVDGIYTDGTYIPWGCANEAHGCGYTDENGERHMTYPILAGRELVRRLYEGVHARGGRVDAHQSACCVMPMMAFADSYWDGENLQGALAENMEAALDLDAFRCEFYGKNLGVTAQLLAYLQPPKYGMRNAMALSLIHDVIPKPIFPLEEMLPDVATVWKAEDDLGMNDAQWKPYWEKNGSVKCENEHVYISAYEKPEGALAYVSKFGQGSGVETLELPEYATSVTELFDGKEYPVVDGKVELPMEPSTAYMLRIR